MTLYCVRLLIDSWRYFDGDRVVWCGLMSVCNGEREISLRRDECDNLFRPGRNSSSQREETKRVLYECSRSVSVVTDSTDSQRKSALK